jgi:hypothetical protein
VLWCVCVDIVDYDMVVPGHSSEHLQGAACRSCVAANAVTRWPVVWMLRSLGPSSPFAV